MGMSAVASHQLKFVAAGAFLVLLWFGYRLGLHGGGNGGQRLGQLVHGGPQFEPAHYTAPAGRNHSAHADVLSLEAAAQFCANFRLAPLAREEAAARRIYDLLLVNTELEMLDVRFGQMSAGVDYFVVLEADRTFTDKPKPLFVQDNWARFAAYHGQIIRRTMDLGADSFKDTWGRETASRNALYEQVVPFLTGDEAAAAGDVLLVSDVDEMFKPETLRALRNCDVPDLVTARSRMFYYSFQWLQDQTWDHPQATLYQGPAGTTRLPNDVRAHSDGGFVFPDGGWHCSYCFSTLAEIIEKIISFSHTEMDQPQFKDPVKIIDRVRNGKDM